MPSYARSQGSLLQRTWEKTFFLLRTRRMLILPFAIITGLEIITIAALFFLIQPPLVKYIAPVVLRFWGEQFLHYPFNLLLISKFFYYAQMGLAVILGTFMSGVTISAVRQYTLTRNNTFLLGQGAKQALLKFVHLLIITLIVVCLVQLIYSLEQKVLFKIMARERNFLGIAKDLWVIIGTCAAGVTSGLVQVLFAFAQTIVIVDNKNFLSALMRNFKFIAGNFFTAIMLVLLPLLVYLPVALLKADLFKLMNQTIPEVLFVVLGAGVVLGLLINVVITVSVTIAYLERSREAEEEQE